MKDGLFHIIAFILLIIATITFTGIATTASALAQANSSNACCDHDSTNAPAEAPPCSIPDCPCPSCLAATLPGQAKAGFSPLISPSSHQPLSQRLHLSGFGRSIDYPPET